MAKNPFTRHPNEVGETYGEHFVAASGFGLRMIWGGLACLVHAVFPFLCVTTGSDTTRVLNRRLTGRADKVNWERHPII
jgi:hypothetical protein